MVPINAQQICCVVIYRKEFKIYNNLQLTVKGRKHDFNYRL